MKREEGLVRGYAKMDHKKNQKTVGSFSATLIAVRLKLACSNVFVPERAQPFTTLHPIALNVTDHDYITGGKKTGLKLG